MSAMQSPEVVHAKKDIDVPADRCYFGLSHKVRGDVWASNAQPMVGVSVRLKPRT
jgi:hypothetical protein